MERTFFIKLTFGQKYKRVYSHFLSWFCNVRLKSCQVAVSPFVIVLRKLLKSAIAELNVEKFVNSGNVDANSQQVFTTEREQ